MVSLTLSGASPYAFDLSRSISSFFIERSRWAAESALRSRTDSRRSSFFLTPTSLGLRLLRHPHEKAKENALLL